MIEAARTVAAMAGPVTKAVQGCWHCWEADDVALGPGATMPGASLALRIPSPGHDVADVDNPLNQWIFLVR